MSAAAYLEVQHALSNAASARRCGTQTSDVDVLKEALEEAYETIADLSDSKDHDLAIEAKDERIAELEGEASCALDAKDRKDGKACCNDDCAACRLAWASLEKDCGTTDERRTAGLCGASHLGVDRCCECAAHLAKIETDGEIEERDNEIARLTKERDEARAVTPSESADTIDAIVRAEESKRETLTREIEGLRNQLQIVTAERNAAIVAADSRPAAPAKVKPVKAHDGPSLFDLPAAAAASPVVKAKRVKRAGVKKYPVGK